MSNDLISRQEAIDLVESFYKCDKNVLNIMVFKLKQLPSAQPEITVDHALTEEEIKNIKQKMADSPLVFMPSAQPEPQWIPCSEMMPEEDVKVLISYRYKEGEGDTSHVNVDITSYGQMYFGGRKVAGEKHWRPPFEYFSSNYEVIAWMPLPDPPKGERA